MQKDLKAFQNINYIENQYSQKNAVLNRLVTLF